MRARGASRAATESHQLAFGNAISFFDAHLREMQIESEQSLTVVDHDAVAFEVKSARQDHCAAVDRSHWSAAGHAKIESLMRTLHCAVKHALHSEDVGNLGADGTLKLTFPLALGCDAFERFRFYLLVVLDHFHLFG